MQSFFDAAKLIECKAETVEGKNMKEWKLTFKNPAEKDATKQTLYMFYTLTGNFIAANFTGK